MRDDRISNREVPVEASMPRFTDINGMAWQDKPDNRLRRQLKKVGISTDEEFHVEGLLAKRAWPEIMDFLTMIERRSSGDDARRIQEARMIAMGVIKEQKAELEDA